MKSKLLKNIVLVLALLLTNQTYSQTCGFGCLCLSGVFGGYSIQQYEADGLNNYLSVLSTNDNQLNFKEGRGYKVGINLVRADYGNFFFTFKGYYQFLSEEKEIKIDDGYGFDYTTSAKLKMDNWGIGLDLGIPFGSFVDWKIVEGELKFFRPSLSMNVSYNNPAANFLGFDNTYSPDKVKMGFSVGSGLIFNIVEDYISLEATGMYSFIEIDYLTNDDSGNKIPTETESKLVSKGGLQAVVQLNVGIPF